MVVLWEDAFVVWESSVYGEECYEYPLIVEECAILGYDFFFIVFDSVIDLPRTSEDEHGFDCFFADDEILIHVF